MDKIESSRKFAELLDVIKYRKLAYIFNFYRKKAKAEMEKNKERGRRRYK